MIKPSSMKPPSPVFDEPVSFPRLSAGEIHLWSTRLIPRPRLLRHFHTLLDGKERKRLISFQFRKHQERYILAHGFLRSLLGYYTDEEPRDILIERDEHGKPYLSSHLVEFNLSHSVDLALFGFSWDGSIGVDVEQVRVVPEALDIIRRLFSRQEQWIHFLTATDIKPTVFCEFWTRGEALVKAKGSGFGERVGAISRNQVNYGGMKWKIESFIPFSGYLGAVAYNNNPGKLIYHHLPENWFPPRGEQFSGG